MRKRRDGETPADGRMAGEAIRETVRKQVEMREPPEVERTYRRLRSDGYSDAEAVELISAVLAAEMFYMLTQQSEYDGVRYTRMLRRLPELPSDTDG